MWPTVATVVYRIVSLLLRPSVGEPDATNNEDGRGGGACGESLRDVGQPGEFSGLRPERHEGQQHPQERKAIGRHVRRRLFDDGVGLPRDVYVQRVRKTEAAGREVRRADDGIDGDYPPAHGREDPGDPRRRLRNPASTPREPPEQ